MKTGSNLNFTSEKPSAMRNKSQASGDRTGKDRQVWFSKSLREVSLALVTVRMGGKREKEEGEVMSAAKYNG